MDMFCRKTNILQNHQYKQQKPLTENGVAPVGIVSFQGSPASESVISSLAVLSSFHFPIFLSGKRIILYFLR